jgi:hypothetical protein
MHPSFTTLAAAALACAFGPALAHDRLATVQFSHCTEFVGLAPIDTLKARAALPARYSLISDAAGARLVVRAVDCAGVRVGSGPVRRGRVAQIGLLIASPDGTATDPNTSINNYTLTYASDSPALVQALREAGVPAALDETLAIEVNPPQGTGSEYYAAVSAGAGGGRAWFLHGTVNTPGFATTFLANWWRLDGGREIKMATDIPAISFDFASQMSFTTSRLNGVGQLLAGNQVAGFPLSFRGAFAAGTMVTTVSR